MSNRVNLLDGQKVIVIGGSSGIGRSVAAAALSHNASVVITSSSQDRVNAALETLRQSIQGKTEVSVTGRAFDVGDFTALKDFLSKEGPFNHLVITAGGVPEHLSATTVEIDEGVKSQFDSRYWSIVVAAQHIYKNSLIKPGGSIITTVGTSHLRPAPGWSLLSGIAGAIESSTRGLAVDLKPIRVNSIAPGLVDTEFFAQMPTQMRDGIFRAYQEKSLVGHVGKPEELAEAYIFATKCTYLTGQVIYVEGESLLPQ